MRETPAKGSTPPDSTPEAIWVASLKRQSFTNRSSNLKTTRKQAKKQTKDARNLLHRLACFSGSQVSCSSLIVDSSSRSPPAQTFEITIGHLSIHFNLGKPKAPTLSPDILLCLGQLPVVVVLEPLSSESGSWISTTAPLSFSKQLLSSMFWCATAARVTLDRHVATNSLNILAFDKFWGRSIVFYISSITHTRNFMPKGNQHILSKYEIW